MIYRKTIKDKNVFVTGLQLVHWYYYVVKFLKFYIKY